MAVLTSALQLGLGVLIIMVTSVLCYTLYTAQDKFFPITNWKRLPYSDTSYGTWIALYALHDEILHRGAPLNLDAEVGGKASWVVPLAANRSIQLMAIRIADVAKPVERPFRHLQYVEYDYHADRDLREAIRAIADDFPGVTVDGTVITCRGAWSGQIQCMMYYCASCAVDGKKYTDIRESLMRDIASTIHNPARGFELEQALTKIKMRDAQ